MAASCASTSACMAASCSRFPARRLWKELRLHTTPAAGTRTMTTENTYTGAQSLLLHQIFKSGSFLHFLGGKVCLATPYRAAVSQQYHRNIFQLSCGGENSVFTLDSIIKPNLQLHVNTHIYNLNYCANKTHKSCCAV